MRQLGATVGPSDGPRLRVRPLPRAAQVRDGVLGEADPGRERLPTLRRDTRVQVDADGGEQERNAARASP